MEEQSAAGIQLPETPCQLKSVHTRTPNLRASLCQAVEFVPSVLASCSCNTRGVRTLQGFRMRRNMHPVSRGTVESVPRP